MLSDQWICGFTDGEGCFHIGISAHPSSSTGYQVLLEFVITQHKRDEQLLYRIKERFGVGVVRNARARNCDIKCYRVRGHANLRDIIIPFFEQNPLLTQKKFDFAKFRRVVILMERKEHLTEEGLKEIRRIRGESQQSATSTTNIP